MIKRRIVIVYWALAVFFLPNAVYAYIDPATTTYLIQIATALVVMAGVSLTIFLYRFRTISQKIKFWIYGLFYRTARAEKPEIKVAEPIITPEYVMPGAAAPPELTEFDESLRPELSKIGESPEKRVSAVPLASALSFTFIVIGCLELAIRHSTEIPFTMISMVPFVLLLFALCLAVLLIVFKVLRGRAFEIIISIGAAVLIAGWLQGNFLNVGLGQMTGAEVDWSALKPQIALSLICWLACLVIVLLLWRKAKKAWRGLLITAPVLLIIVQSVSLISAIGNDIGNQEWGDGVFWRNAQEMLTIDRINEVASDKNAIIIVLDKLDDTLIDEMKDTDPGFFDPLDGFTRFDDFVTHYGSTFPSVSSILTGHRYMFDMPRTRFFDYSWENADFMRGLNDKGFDIRLYMDRGFTFSYIHQLRGLASNIVEGEISTKYRTALIKLIKLSGYRFAPMPLKQFFWFSPTEFVDTLALTDANAPYIVNDIAYYESLKNNGLFISDHESSFVYIHLLGPHPPHYMDENVQFTGDSTPLRQGMGAFRIVFEYLRQLKELGLYDDAVIVIMGDHGDYDGLELTRPIRTALLVKPSGSAGTPMQVSHAPVSPDQLHATIMESLFGNTGGFGYTFFDINEGDDVIREYTTARFRYEIRGDGRDFANWHLIGQFPDTYEK